MAASTKVAASAKVTRAECAMITFHARLAAVVNAAEGTVSASKIMLLETLATEMLLSPGRAESLTLRKAASVLKPTTILDPASREALASPKPRG